MELTVETAQASGYYVNGQCQLFTAYRLAPKILNYVKSNIEPESIKNRLENLYLVITLSLESTKTTQEALALINTAENSSPRSYPQKKPAQVRTEQGLFRRNFHILKSALKMIFKTMNLKHIVARENAKRTIQTSVLKSLDTAGKKSTSWQAPFPKE